MMVVTWRAAALATAVFVVSFMGLPTGNAYADFRQSQLWFDRLSVDERADLQGNLILLAHYGGLVDSQFGAGTYHAIVDWQISVASPPSGVLSAEQIGLLDQMASQAMSDMGMDLIEDLDGRFSLMLPMGLLPERERTQFGSRYEAMSGDFSVETFWRTPSEGRLADQFAQAKAAARTTVSYSAITPQLYVVTGFVEGRYFYELVHAAVGGTAGFRFTYDDEHRKVGGIASVFAASYSAPINATAELVPNQQVVPQELEKVTIDPFAPKPKKDRAVTSIPDTNLEEGVNVFGSFITFDDVPGLLALVGDIGPKTPLDLRRALNAMDDPTALALMSDGGNVASALMVAYEVYELGLSTYVIPDTGCYSACAFIFLAGRERLVEGELGVHQVWGEDADASSAQTVVSDILEAFNQFGVSQEVTSAMLRTVPENMYIFSAAELTDWNLNTP